MTADVIPLRKHANSDALGERGAERWHTGPAVCTRCRHRWHHTAGPIPDGGPAPLTLDCPKCVTDTGTWSALFVPADEEMQFRCPHCDGWFFVIQPHRVMCVGCAATVRPFDPPAGEPA